MFWDQSNTVDWTTTEVPGSSQRSKCSPGVVCRHFLKNHRYPRCVSLGEECSNIPFRKGGGGDSRLAPVAVLINCWYAQQARSTKVKLVLPTSLEFS